SSVAENFCRSVTNRVAFFAAALRTFGKEHEAPERRESVCTLRPEAIKTVSDWAISYRRFWEESFDKLDVVVNQMKKTEVRDDKKHG
ncbi:MAG: hypothetical protein WBG29_04905, partial [Candidatus Acidiferrales bacterium]